MIRNDYFKLATWDARNCCWRDGKRAFDTTAGAIESARQPGRYRISRITPAGRVDLVPFDIAGTPQMPASVAPKQRQGHPTATSLVYGKRYGKGTVNA